MRLTFNVLSNNSLGKTLAFCLPILEQLISGNINTAQRGATPQVLIMSPTRELAKQIVEEFQTIGKAIGLRIQAIYGGVSLQDNYTVLQRGIDVVVGTPGRIKDLLERKWLSFSAVKHVVLDEADQMLDMGFTEEIQAIFDAFNDHSDTTEISSSSNSSKSSSSSSSPSSSKKQVLLFSATMPRWVHTLADKYLSSERSIVDLVTGTSAVAVTTIQHIAIPGMLLMSLRIIP
jgi:superfamily II DNA/RNA helicase